MWYRMGRAESFKYGGDRMKFILSAIVALALTAYAVPAAAQ